MGTERPVPEPFGVALVTRVAKDCKAGVLRYDTESLWRSDEASACAYLRKVQRLAGREDTDRASQLA